ncbi:hypothetical protein N9C58_00155 [bacterium]|nr:hypothetical protein [bacterium]
MSRTVGLPAIHQAIIVTFKHAGETNASHTRCSNPRAEDDPTGTGIWVVSVALVGWSAILLSALVRLVGFVNPVLLGSEDADRVVWLSVLFVCAVLGLFALLRSTRDWLVRRDAHLGIGIAALCVLTVGIAWREYVPGFPPEIQQGWWRGFGPSVSLATALLVPIVVLLGYPRMRPLIRYLALVGVVMALIWYLPVLINVPWSFDAHHANPVLNDLLAPYVGKFPLSDQVPQYTNLLGFVYVPIAVMTSELLGAHTLSLTTSLFLSALAVVTAALMVWIGYRILPKRFKVMSPILVLPLMLVAGGSRGSIGESFSAFPARLLFPAALLALMILTQRRWSAATLVAIGCVAGAGVVNNIELGMVALVAAAGTIAVSDLNALLRQLLFFLVGVLVPTAGFLVAAALSGHPVQAENIGAYARGFASGFYGLPMPMAGTYVLVLSISGGALVLGVLALRGTPPPGRHPAAIVALYSGVMGLGGFAYYVGRSSSTGQLQALLPFMTLAACATWAMLGSPVPRSSMSPAQLVSSVTVLVLPALALGAVLQAPDPRAQWGKVIPDAQSSFMRTDQADVDAIRESLHLARSKGISGPVRIVVDNANIVSAVEGVPNASPVSYLQDAAINESLQRALCSAVRGVEVDLLVTASAVQTALGACGSSLIVTPLGTDYVLVHATGSPSIS